MKQRWERPCSLTPPYRTLHPPLCPLDPPPYPFLCPLVHLAPRNSDHDQIAPIGRPRSGDDVVPIHLLVQNDVLAQQGLHIHVHVGGDLAQVHNSSRDDVKRDDV